MLQKNIFLATLFLFSSIHFIGDAMGDVGTEAQKLVKRKIFPSDWPKDSADPKELYLRVDTDSHLESKWSKITVKHNNQEQELSGEELKRQRHALKLDIAYNPGQKIYVFYKNFKNSKKNQSKDCTKDLRSVIPHPGDLDYRPPSGTLNKAVWKKGPALLEVSRTYGHLQCALRVRHRNPAAK